MASLSFSPSSSCEEASFTQIRLIGDGKTFSEESEQTAFHENRRTRREKRKGGRWRRREKKEEEGEEKKEQE